MHKKNAARMGALLMSCMISATVSMAQYNRNFVSNPGGLPISGEALDIAPASYNTQCVLSNISDFPIEFDVPPGFNLINFKNVHTGGYAFWNRTYLSGDDNVQFQPTKLVRTSDGGFIATGRIVTDSFINPGAIKVDSLGVLQWSQFYRSNPVLGEDQPETSITRVTDDSSGIESYIIVRTGISDDSLHAKDVIVNALRIKGNGDLIWNKKYHLGVRKLHDKIVKDYPRTVTEVHDSTGRFYFIAGTHFSQDSSGSVTDSSLFFMGINKDGHITRTYRQLHIDAIPMNQDAIYDSSYFNKSIIMSYTLANSKLVNNNRSQIGVMKLDRSLNVTMNYYYHGQRMIENRAAGISLNASNNAYVIACNTKDSLDYNGENISLLKITKSGTPVFFSRYNVARKTKANGILKFDSSTAPESYYIVGRRQSNHIIPSTGNYITDKRLLKTDASGNACGVDYLNPRQQSLRDSVIARSYYETDVYGSEFLYIAEADIAYEASDCDSARAPNFKNAPVTVSKLQQASKVKLYPTLLQSGDQQLNIATTLTESTRLTIALYSIAGRKVATTSFNQAQGNTISQWPLQQLSSGTYVIHIVSNDGTIQEKFRITKL